MLNKYMKNLNENKYVRVEMELDTKTICIVSKYIQNCLVISFHFFKFMDVLQFLYYYGRKDTIAYASLFIYLVSCNMFMTDIMIFFTSLWSWGSLLLSYVLHHLNKSIVGEKSRYQGLLWWRLVASSGPFGNCFWIESCIDRWLWLQSSIQYSFTL